jgi:hypothetical protein
MFFKGCREFSVTGRRFRRKSLDIARKVNIVALFACHFFSVWRAFRKVATATAERKNKNKSQTT